MIQRLKEITYLRAFAALSIVWIHVTSGYTHNLPAGAALNQFSRYGSPVFIMISGFLLYHIELKRPAPSYMHFFKHRFLKVGVPYAIWTIIYSTYTMRGLFVNPGSFDMLYVLKTYLVNIVTGNGYVHLYFILIMIQLYALFPFLKKGIEQYTYTVLTFAALISILFQSLIYLHRLSIIVLPSLGIAWAALFPGWLIFFCLGIYLRIKFRQTMDFWRQRKVLCAIIWTSLLFATIAEGWISPVNITLRPTVSLLGIATFFLFYLIFETLKNKISKSADQRIEWIASNSFDIYLVHPLALNFLVLPFNWEGYGGLTALYTAELILTCLIIYCKNQIKELIRTARSRLIFPDAKKV